MYNIRINDRLAFVTFSKKDYLKNDDVTYKIKRKDNKLAIYTEIEGEGAKGDVISINDVSCFYVYDDIEFIKKNDLSIEITRTLRGNDAALNKAQKEASKTKIIKKATIEFAKKTKIEPIIIVGGQVSRLMEIMPEKLL